MTASNFDRALSLVLASEGGYSDKPDDPGGATKYGITLKTLEAYRGKPVTPEEVKALMVAEAGDIYEADYWMPIKADSLPSGIDYAVFDFAVNSGPRTAVKFLQRCLSVTDDGIVGPQTLAAIAQVRAADLVNSLCDRRLAYLRSLGTWVDFGKGWSNRIASVRKDALTLATIAPQPGAPNSAPTPRPAPSKPPPILTPRQPDDPGPVTPKPRPIPPAVPITAGAGAAILAANQMGVSMWTIIAFAAGVAVGLVIANWSTIKSVLTADPTAKPAAKPAAPVQGKPVQAVPPAAAPVAQPAPPANQPPAQKG